MILDMNYEKINNQIKKNLDGTCTEMKRAIQQVSVITENVGIPECADLFRDYFLDFGCSDSELAPTDGNPVVFANYNANAEKTLIIFLWYDTVDLMEGWLAPPLDGQIINFESFGKCLVGRGAFTKGSLVAFVEAMKSLIEIRGELPVNLKFVIEGEENIGSRNLPQFVERNIKKLQTGDGVLFPRVVQDVTGRIRLSLGSKGMIRFDLVCSGKRWGKGPQESDCHSAEKAWVDNPLWRLLHGLSTLRDGGKITIPGFYDGLLPPTIQEEKMLKELENTFNIQQYAKRIDVKPYDMSSRELLRTYIFSPTLNVEKITGAMNNFRIPKRSSAQMEIRYLPNQNAQDLLSKIRNHLDSHRYPDIDVDVKGIIDCAKVPISDPLIQSVIETYKTFDVVPEIWPNSVRSSPWNVFSSKLNLSLASGGLGHGGRHHEPNEYFVIEPQPPYFGLITCQQSYIMIIDNFASSRTRELPDDAASLT